MNSWNMLMHWTDLNQTQQTLAALCFITKHCISTSIIYFFPLETFLSKCTSRLRCHGWKTISFPDPSHYTALRTVPTNSDSHFHAPLNSILHSLKRTSRVGCIIGRPLEYEMKSSLWRRDPFHAGK